MAEKRPLRIGMPPGGLSRLLMAGLLGALGALINFVPIPLYPGVGFPLGAAFSLVAAIAGGPLLGGIAGFIAGLPTLTYWDDWAGVISHTLEGVVVGALAPRIMPIVLNPLYWLIIRTPVLILYFALFSEVPSPPTLYSIILKGVLSAIVYTALVESFFLFPGTRRLVRRLLPRARLPALTFKRFVIVLAVFLTSLPSLFFTVRDAQRYWREEVGNAGQLGVLVAQATAFDLNSHFPPRAEGRLSLHEQTAIVRILEQHRLPRLRSLSVIDPSGRLVLHVGEPRLPPLRPYLPLNRTSGLRSWRVPSEPDRFVPLRHFAYSALGWPGWYVIVEPDRTVILNAINQRLLARFLLVLLVVFAAILVSSYFGTLITRPMRRLQDVMREVAGGRLEARARPEELREVEELGASFNMTSAHLEALVNEIRESERRLNQAQQVAHVGSWEWDLLSDRVTMSDENIRLLGLTPRDSISTYDAFLQRVHPDDRALVDERLQRAIRGEAPYAAEFRVVRADGEVRILFGQAEVIVDEAHRPKRMLGTLHDVTERKRLEDELRDRYERIKELDRLKNAFINAVSHDLRTPLTSIKGYAEFLEDEIGGPLSQQQHDFVLQIEKGTERLVHMVDDLLDYARLGAGTFRLKIEPGDFSEKIREVAESLRPQQEDLGLRMEVEVPETPLVVPMDPQRIERVLVNLIGNAFKYTPSGGRVRVRARLGTEGLVCEVEDTGVGIEPVDIPKLFEPFSQLESGIRKGGTGLGLNICKAIVEAHGGSIGVRSNGAGKGSLFWFTLPLHPNAPRELSA